MLALVPLLVPVATAVATGVVLLVLLIAVNAWFRSWAYDDEAPKRGLIGRITGWAAAKLKAAVRAAEKRLTAALSNAVAQKSGAIVGMFTNLYELVSRLGDEIANEAQQTYQALKVLRDVTLPAEIQQALKPVVQLANQAAALATGTANTLTAVSVEIASGLASLPWGVPIGLPNRVAAWFNAFEQIWDYVWGPLSARVNKLRLEDVPNILKRLDALETGTVGKIGTRLKAIELRLGKIETYLYGEVTDTLAALKPLLNPVALGVLVLAALKIAAPNLFCRNTTKATQAVCGMQESLLDSLIAGTFLVALVLNPREIARLGEDAIGLTSGIWAASVGEALDELGLT